MDANEWGRGCSPPCTRSPPCYSPPQNNLHLHLFSHPPHCTTSILTSSPLPLLTLHPPRSPPSPTPRPALLYTATPCGSSTQQHCPTNHACEASPPNLLCLDLLGGVEVPPCSLGLGGVRNAFPEDFGVPVGHVVVPVIHVCKPLEVDGAIRWLQRSQAKGSFVSDTEITEGTSSAHSCEFPHPSSCTPSGSACTHHAPATSHKDSQLHVLVCATMLASERHGKTRRMSVRDSQGTHAYPSKCQLLRGSSLRIIGRVLLSHLRRTSVPTSRFASSVPAEAHQCECSSAHDYWLDILQSMNATRQREEVCGENLNSMIDPSAVLREVCCCGRAPREGGRGGGGRWRRGTEKQELRRGRTPTLSGRKM